MCTGMYLNDHPPIAGVGELWGFPKKLASTGAPTTRPTRSVGTLDYGKARVAKGDHGLQAPCTLDAGAGPWPGIAPAELSAQDHSARGRHAAHL